MAHRRGVSPEELLALITKNDQTAVDMALRAGADPNGISESQGIPPIIAAARRQQNGIVRLLKDYGARIDARDKKGWTPLHWAAALGNLELVTMLCGWGAPLNAVTNTNKRAIDLAQLSTTQNPAVIDALTAADFAQNGISLPTPQPMAYRTRSVTNAQRALVAGIGDPFMAGLTVPTMSYSQFTLDDILPGAGLYAGLGSTSAGLPPGMVKRPSKGSVRPKSVKDKPHGIRQCAECKTTDTPQWRRGPQGMGSLCNACGLKFIHLHNRDKKNARRRELYMMQKLLKQQQQQGAP